MVFRGVYFLSNNRAYEITVAFLNSFRAHNPDIPLCLIPYDDDYDEIEKLQEKYHFQIFNNPDLLKQCDEISLEFHGVVKGAYRKLALWEGAFDEFIYIDVDTIVLDDINFVFQCLDRFDCLVSHSNIPANRQWVWKDSIYETGYLNHEQIAFSANTGFIASTKSFMAFDWILSSVPKALALKEHMTLHCMEQPFLNYLMVTNNKLISSLSVLHETEEYEDLMLECWAGTRGGIVEGGKMYLPNHPPIFLVHWAGVWSPNPGDILLYSLLKFLGLKKAKPVFNSRFPYKDLWNYYRNLEVTNEELVL